MPSYPHHRHWVIWPLFLSVLVVSSFPWMHEEQLVRAPATFSEGEEEVVLQDDGMITFQVNDIFLYGMHGAFTVSYQADHVSVGALTTPVLARLGDTWSLVPIGFQWRNDERDVLLPLPSAFRYAKLQALRHSSPSLARWDLSFTLPGTLRLPAAERRRHLSTLTREIARGRSLARLVQDHEMSVALSSGDGYHILPSLLAELQDVPLDRALLFPFLFQEEEGALLALFHPVFRDHAALLALDELSPEARAVYYFSLPRSDLLPDALSRLALSRWEQDLTKELSERTDPLPFFATLLATVEDVLRECARHGYVERAQRYVAAMQHFSALLELTPELQERVNALPSLSLVSDQPIPFTDSSSSAASSVSPVSLGDIKKRAVADLTAQGGMFIPKTTIEPISPTAVRVASLVLATSKGDELLDFIYDTEQQEVRDILHGDMRYPYAVPLTQFVEWVRRE